MVPLEVVVQPAAFVRRQGALIVPLLIGGLVGFPVADRRVGVADRRLGQFMVQQEQVVGFGGAGREAEPGLDDVRVGVEVARLLLGAAVAVVEKVFVDEEVVLDPLEPVQGVFGGAVGVQHIPECLVDRLHVVGGVLDLVEALLGPVKLRPVVVVVLGA
jgi:hypothetical protein